MKKLSILLAFLILTASVNAQINWKFDKAHTNVRFAVSHLVISEVDGVFKSFDGSVKSNSVDNFEGAEVKFTVDINSINTENEKRDDHLRSEDFFYAEKYPKMTFVSKSMKKVEGSDSKYKLVGDLTIRGNTNQIVLDVKYNGTIEDPWGNTRAGFKLTGELNRFDYGLKWNKLLEAGGAVVGEEVELTANVEIIKE